MFLWWRHVSLIFHVPGSPVLSSLHLKKQSTSSILYWLALGEKYLLSSLLGILRLSQAFSIDVPTPHFLFPLWGQFLRFYAFCSFCKARLSADILPFPFSRVLLNAQVCVLFPNPAESGWLSVHAHCLSANAYTCHCWGSEQGANHRLHRPLGMPVGHWGDLQSRHPQWLVAGSLMVSVKGLVGSTSLECVPSPGCYSPCPFPHLRHAAHLGTLDGASKRWNSGRILPSWGNEAPIHTPHGRNCRPRWSLGTELCHLWWGAMVEGSCFSYPLQCV